MLKTCFMQMKLPGGWIVGCVDDAGQYSGSQIAFLYPGYSTALFGEFHKGEMVKAKPARLCGIDFMNGVLCPSFEIISDRLVYFKLGHKS